MSLIQNAVKITCITPPEYLVSASHYDCQVKQLPNGNSIMVDGGNDYVRRGYKTRNDGYEEFSLDDSMPFEEICEKMLWGTNGKSGKEPRKYVLLKDCETDHLQAILRTQTHVKGSIAERVINFWLGQRQTAFLKARRSHHATKSAFKKL